MQSIDYYKTNLAKGEASDQSDSLNQPSQTSYLEQTQTHRQGKQTSKQTEKGTRCIETFDSNSCRAFYWTPLPVIPTTF